MLLSGNQVGVSGTYLTLIRHCSELSCNLAGTVWNMPGYLGKLSKKPLLVAFPELVVHFLGLWSFPELVIIFPELTRHFLCNFPEFTGCPQESSYIMKRLSIY